MWVKARTLAALAGRLPESLTVDVAFDKPLYLPSTVDYLTAPARGGWDFAVRNSRAEEIQHLTGTVRPF
jgi:hypothetical protein